MDKKYVIIPLIALCSSFAFAETCPTIKEVKSSLLVGWKAYDSDDGTPLSAKRKAAFIHDLEEFALAEWAAKNHKTGSIHCYYKDRSGSALEAYLAKDNFVPNNTNSYWYKVSGFTQCAAGMDKCKFTSHSMMPQQLARK